MTGVQAQRIVVAAMVVIALVTVIGEAAKGHAPAPRLLIAGALIFVVLALLADFAPQVAGPLAAMVAIAVVLTRGEPAFAAISRRVRS